MKPLRIEGNVDALFLVKVVEHLHDTHDVSWNLMKKDWFLCIEPTDYSYYMADSLTKDAIINKIIHHPDVMIVDKEQNLKCIIEIDGSIHDTPSGMRKTAKRNADYQILGIPCIIVNLADCKLEKIDPLEELSRKFIKWLKED